MIVTVNVDHGDAHEPLVKKAHERMVLCRECKYQFQISRCPLMHVIYDISDYDYCSYGKPKVDKGGDDE